jgi:hypothetical protein
MSLSSDTGILLFHLVQLYKHNYNRYVTTIQHDYAFTKANALVHCLHWIHLNQWQIEVFDVMTYVHMCSTGPWIYFDLHAYVFYKLGHEFI